MPGEVAATSGTPAHHDTGAILGPPPCVFCRTRGAPRRARGQGSTPQAHFTGSGSSAARWMNAAICPRVHVAAGENVVGLVPWVGGP
jgi:hypothetical protein